MFSNLFLVAQLFKTINADSLQGMRASKEILANEIGVVFNAGGRRAASSDNGGDTDPELVSSEGTVEGGVFRFRVNEMLDGVAAFWVDRLEERP